MGDQGRRHESPREGARSADLRSHASFDAPQFSFGRRADGSAPGDLTEALAAADGSAPGRDLAEALATGLRRRGFESGSAEEYDEFMWTLDVTRNQGSWVLGAGYFGDPDVGQWLVFVETRGARHLFRRLRGRPPRWTVDELAAALHSVIVDDLEARPRWYTKEEWMAGPQGPGTLTPVTP